MKRIFFTVTNDLSYDQRMQRICTTLAKEGYEVVLIGRKLPRSLDLASETFRQKRLRCFFNKGFLFYAEYNLRLLFYLLFQKADCLCAIDLDTILPVLIASRVKRCKRIYDAHEYFTELKEVHTRPTVQRVWKAIERFALPKFSFAYTVGTELAKIYQKQYGVHFWTISNFPVLRPIENEPAEEPFLFYGGAVNEGRAFENLLPALKRTTYKLVVVGDGNFMPQLKALVKNYQLEDRVALKGMQPPKLLRQYAETATLGIGLAEKEGLNQYLSLPNKFTDYIHAGLPQITMNYPEYQKINQQFPVAVLIDHLGVELIAATITKTMENRSLLQSMRAACIKAREVYNWQQEEKKLIAFYQMVFNN